MDVLVTPLAIVFHDKEICCGKNFAFGDKLRTDERQKVEFNRNSDGVSNRWVFVRPNQTSINRATLSLSSLTGGHSRVSLIPRKFERGNSMTNLNKVVTSLRTEYVRLQKEMERVGKALHALGHTNGAMPRRAKRTLSKEARQRIAEAQRLRWARVRKQAASAKS